MPDGLEVWIQDDFKRQLRRIDTIGKQCFYFASIDCDLFVGFHAGIIA